jgi:hypothetical protein
MKKLSILVLISAFLTFTAAMALANDDNNGFKHFNGTYEMSASGSCIHSQNGYGTETVVGPGYSFINASSEGIVYAGTTVSNGTWIFNKNGKGTYSYIMYATVTPPIQAPPLPCPIPGGIRIFKSLHKDANGNVVNEYAFTYDITNFGDITILTAEGDTLEGSISIDKKAITLFDSLRIKGPGADVCPWYNIICTATRTLIKVHD